SELFFVGFATAEKLKASGVLTIGDLANSNPKVLNGLLGKQGTLIYNYANGYDDSPVSLYNQREKIKSVGNGITFKRNLTTKDDILTAVISLSDTVAARLRKYQMKAYGIKLDIKDPFFKTISRQKQLDMPTNLAEQITKTTMEILKASWKENDPIRLLTITAINLADETQSEQLSFFADLSEGREKGEKIERTMDNIRRKYGDSSITYGQVINNDLGIDI
ncbi:MAG: DNA polymerase IV, partial [Anaerovoracaceae bacterium]